MGYRSFGVFLLVALILLSTFGTADAQQSPAIIGESSPEGRSVRAAADFLRGLDDTAIADSALDWLKKGALRITPVEKGAPSPKGTPPGAPVVLADGAIVLPAALFPEGKALSVVHDYDKVTKLSWALALASHAGRRSPLLAVAEALSPGSVAGGGAVDDGAWLRSLDGMSRWCITLCDRHNAISPEDYEARYYVLEKISTILTSKIALTEHFLKERKAEGSPKLISVGSTWVAADKDLLTRTKRIMDAYEDAAWDDLLDIAWTAVVIADAACKSERVTTANRYLPQWAKDRLSDGLVTGVITGITLDALADDEVSMKEVDLVYRLYFDRACELGGKCLEEVSGKEGGSGVSLAIESRDCLPGGALTFIVTNGGQKPLKATLPTGMALTPSDAAYRRIVVGAPVQVECAPCASSVFNVTTYTIDGLKRALPDQPSAGVAWTVCEDLALSRRAAALIGAGQRLSAEGKLEQALMEPTQYLHDVTQVALWQALRKIGDPGGWELIKPSLEKRWEALPLEKRPSPGERGRIVESIVKHAEAVVKEAGR